MSIDTLLEAARYLEWQAQQQQITREEEEKRENALAAREAEQQQQQQQQQQLRRAAEMGPSLMPAPMQVNHVSWGVETQRLHQHQHQHQTHLPPMQASMPITVIPIPMVQANAAPQTHPAVTVTAAGAPPHLHAVGPVPVVAPVATALSPQPAPLLSSPSSTAAAVAVGAAPGGKDSPSPPRQRHLVAAVKTEASILPQTGTSPKQQQQQLPPNPQPPPPPAPHGQPAQLLQPYTGPIIAAPQHALLPQPTLTQPHAQPGQMTVRPNGASLEDVRGLDGKRRPGGAGTREVHNKLEKNRRAHLKECFETLKRNVPNVDEKKTSNLSVLRSALRYIQTLKRKEKEYEHEMERLAREKIATQQRLAELKNELGQSMDMLEIDRLLRQTVQPEDDQASTSTASGKGEDNFDQDVDSDMPLAPSTALPKLPHAPLSSDPRPAMAPASLLPAQLQLPPQHLTIHPHKLAAAAVTVSTLPSAVTVSVSSSSSQPQALVTPQAIAPAPLPSVPVSTTTTHLVVPQQHPQQTTVIAHASMSHASVIQAVNHVLPAGSKHLAHIAPSGGAPGQAGPTVGQPIGHITVHPVAHLSQHLPALYPQSVAVSQPAVVGHIAHALTAAHHPSHAPIVNGAVPVTGPQAAATVVGKPTAVVAHHHPQLVGQTVLNPVTMVTVPQFPVSTLKLA
ncbi:MAX network transcriptional repressor b isoform X1 [Alosa sapidissima]|uniref:MAX network transcriptional repressor b isoform X1 n=2 Tax=Alosa sapidissima TaxID=34773 RepID=UPI001C09A0C8|nr:MAX network transcriptional repressor b isoform X1 [Alosa sapidissima]